MKHLFRPLLCVIGCLLISACGSSGSSPTTPSATQTTSAPLISVFSVTLAPSPITAAPSPNGISNWYRVTYTLTLHEQAGLGANVNYIQTTITDAILGGTATANNINPQDIINVLGSNHISALGTMTMQLYNDYHFTLGNRNGTLNLTINLTDERGNTQTKTATVGVQ